jgi:hypothetical protein
MSIACSFAVAVLLLGQQGEGGVASEIPDRYDPRRDPNYSREVSATAPIHWEAVWGLVSEFEARSYQAIDRRQSSSPFAVPQPWHYVQGGDTLDVTPSLAGAAYGSPYGGPFNGYDPWFAGWWEPSPRIPWWSLVPFTTKHHKHHQHQKGKSHNQR